MVKAALIWSDELLSYDFGSGHPMRSVRCKMGAEEISKIPSIDIVKPRYATEEELSLVHTPDYINRVKSGKAGSLDTPVTKYIYDPARLSVGATLKAVELFEEGYRLAVNVCGGWHHAFENEARGFCIFNDIAVGTRFAQNRGFKKVFIIDWDVHHGDGTQRIFKGDNTVFTMSIHQHPSTQYPYVSGYESENDETNLNVPILPSESEQEVMKKVLPLIPRYVKPFKPDIMFVQMGVDGHREDPMSSLDLSERFYDSISRIVARCAKNNGFPVVLLGGGGFNFPKTARLWRMIVENFIEEM